MAELKIEKFKLTIRMDATITVYDGAGTPSDWLKPGSEASVTWNGVPTEEELSLRYRDLSKVATATLEDVLVSSRKRLDESRRGR